MTMNRKEKLEREALIWRLLNGYVSSQGSVTEGVIAAYVAATADYSVEALQRACERYGKGEVPDHDRHWPPGAPELAEQTRLWQAILYGVERRALPSPPAGYRQLPDGSIVVPIGQPIPDGWEATGPLEVTFTGRRIDMRKLTPQQKQWVLENKRHPPADPDEARRVGYPEDRPQRMIANG